MFSQSVIEKLNYYAYLLQDPRDNSVFYVGNGVGNRIGTAAADKVCEQGAGC